MGALKTSYIYNALSCGVISEAAAFARTWLHFAESQSVKGCSMSLEHAMSSEGWVRLTWTKSNSWTLALSAPRLRFVQRHVLQEAPQRECDELNSQRTQRSLSLRSQTTPLPPLALSVAPSNSHPYRLQKPRTYPDRATSAPQRKFQYHITPQNFTARGCAAPENCRKLHNGSTFELVLSIFMTLFELAGYETQEKNLSKQIPLKAPWCLSRKWRFISSSLEYSIGIDLTGDVFAWGKCRFGDNTEEQQAMRKVPGIPAGLKAVCASCGSKLSAILFEDGSIYAWGTGFADTPVPLAETEGVEMICCGSKSIAVYGANGLEMYTSTKPKTKLQTNEAVAMLAPVKDEFAVLLANGELCSTKKLGSSLPCCPGRKDKLFYIASFFGYKVKYITSGFGYFLAITDDGSVYITNADTMYLTSIQLPIVMKDDAICSACLANGRVSLVTDSTRVYVFLMNCLFDMCQDAMNGFIEGCVGITDVCATTDVTYFLQGEQRKVPLASALTVETLIGRRAPVHLQIGGKVVVADPPGAQEYGFCSGDLVRFRGELYLVVGASSRGLVIVNCVDESFVELDSKRKIDLMFNIPLVKRLKRDLIEVELNNGKKLAVDRSQEVMAQFSSFKTGDVITHKQFGRGVVMGTRAGALVVQYQNGVKLARFENNDQLILTHYLTERNGNSVIHESTVDGMYILVEQIEYNKVTPGSIVSHGKQGVGQYIGCCYGNPVVKFLQDCGCVTILEPHDQLSIVRTGKSLCQGYIALNRSPVVADVNEHLCQKLGFKPGDYVKISNNCAYCVGIGSVDGQDALFFETDDMMICDLGVGIFESERLAEAELIARIACPGERLMKTENGTSITLSVNTNDFLTLPVLPLDRVLVNNTVAMVVGVNNGQVYVQQEDTPFVLPLPDNFQLIMRRLNTPTVRHVAVKDEKVSVHTIRLDSESYRGMWFCPGDLVEQENEIYRVIGMVARREFLVVSSTTGEQSLRCLNPCGVLTATLKHRPTFFS